MYVCVVWLMLFNISNTQNVVIIIIGSVFIRFINKYRILLCVAKKLCMLLSVLFGIFWQGFLCNFVLSLVNLVIYYGYKTLFCGVWANKRGLKTGKYTFASIVDVVVVVVVVIIPNSRFASMMIDIFLFYLSIWMCALYYVVCCVCFFSVTIFILFHSDAFSPMYRAISLGINVFACASCAIVFICSDSHTAIGLYA